MPDIQLLYSHYKKYMFYILALFVLGWGFTSYQTIFAGLFIGSAASFFNLWLLYRKTVQFSEALKTGKTVYSLGLLSRLASAVLVILIAIRFPDYFHLISSIVGLMTSYIVILIDSLLRFFIKGKQQEER